MLAGNSRAVTLARCRPFSFHGVSQPSCSLRPLAELVPEQARILRRLSPETHLGRGSVPPGLLLVVITKAFFSTDSFISACAP
jgi:hypothetical protein